MDYTIQHGDTYASIAEAAGHSGEWKVLQELNAPPVMEPGLPIAWLEPGSLVAGVVIQVPTEWLALQVEGQEEPSSGWRPAAELIAEAQAAASDEELEAIEAQAAGRTTVLAAVDARREQLAAPA